MRPRGFTLVEVMVALAIVAIALPAVLMALYQQIDDTAYLRDKSIAAMVAANKLAEMRIVIASTRNLSAGKDNGTATMADRDWHWWVETKATEDVPQFFRIEIDVVPEQEQGEREEKPKQTLYTLTAFMSGDLQVDPEGLNELDGKTPVPRGKKGKAPEPGGNGNPPDNTNPPDDRIPSDGT